MTDRPEAEIKTDDYAIRLTLTYGNDADYSTLDQWQREANPWTVRVENGDKFRSTTFHYWTGPAISDVDVVDAFLTIWSEGQLAMSSDIRQAARNYADSMGEEPSVKLAGGLADTFRKLEYLGLDPLMDSPFDWMDADDFD